MRQRRTPSGSPMGSPQNSQPLYGFSHMTPQERIASFDIQKPQFSAKYGSGAIKNMRMLKLSSEEANQVGSNDICERLGRAVETLGADPQVLASTPVTAYVWHDEQAGQLRFSVARCTPQNLPFSTEIQHVSRVEDIVEQFLRSPYLDGVPSSELQEVAFDEIGVETVRKLAVWTKQLAR
jgi:hypothetical protein